MSKTNNKTHNIQFRVTEEQYIRLKEEADIQGINVNSLAARRVLCSDHASNSISPELMVLLHTMYDMLNVNPENWNKEIINNYKEGLVRLNVLL